MDLPGYRLPPPPSPEKIREVLAAIAESKRPIIYCGGGVVASNAAEELREFATKTGIPVAMTVHGLGSFPSDHYLSLAHARHARHGLRQLRRQRRRPAAGPRRAVRRPRHRQAQRVRQARQDRPRRHRRLGDQQEQGRPHPDPHRRQVVPGGDQPPGRPGRLARLAPADRRLARQRPDDLRPARRRDPAAVRPRAVLEADQGRLHHDHGRRPAPDVGRAVDPVQAAADLDHLRRPGLDGLRPARRDGRPGRLPRRPGRRHRRRRQLPDEHPGAGHASTARSCRSR